MATIPAAGSSLITCVYNDDVSGEPGTLWVILHDNPIIAWVIDESGATPAKPVILGTMITEGPATGDVKSPPWAERVNGMIFIPDMARGSANEFFNFIAFNNGAHRQLYAEFADIGLITEFRQWAGANPSMALSSPPNVA